MDRVNPDRADCGGPEGIALVPRTGHDRLVGFQNKANGGQFPDRRGARQCIIGHSTASS
jgi:hypothetical protein